MLYTIYMIHRSIQPKIEKALNDGLVAIIYGARQTGKTTLAKQIASKYADFLYLNCDDPTVVQNLTERSAIELKAYIGNSTLVVIDEAQRVKNIGISIKLLHDSYPEISLLVTGSSSLDLSNTISEPLTGRSAEFILYPLGILEVSKNAPEMMANSTIMMVRGGYPGMWALPSEDAEDRLRQIALNYLYRDAFSPLVNFDQTTANSILQLLAYQIGNEVNYSEIGQKLDLHKDTVKRYIELLEQAFIVFRLNQYRKNRRSEVGRLRKVYFYDLGIRNALINNFQPIDNRDDKGALWENICLLERRKHLSTTTRHIQSYYWRNKNQREIDLIEAEGNQVHAFEFKLGKKAARIPKEFEDNYPNTSYTVVTPTNFTDILFDKYNPAQTRLLP